MRPQLKQHQHGHGETASEICQNPAEGGITITYRGNLFAKIRGRAVQGSTLKLKYERVPLPSTFNYWKTNFKTEVRSSSSHSKEAMPWKSEVEVANSVNDLKTSRSMSGRVYPIFETLDARIASALKKFIHNANFKKKVHFEERKAQKEDRILRGKRT